MNDSIVSLGTVRGRWMMALEVSILLLFIVELVVVFAGQN